MKAPKYYAGREIDYYLLLVVGIMTVATGVSVLLGGCASTAPIVQYRCRSGGSSSILSFCYYYNIKTKEMCWTREECGG